METPPVPSTSTVSPGCRRPLTNSARQAVRPAVVSVAASSCDQPRGAWVKAVAGRVTASQAKPSMPSPGTNLKSEGTRRPDSHCGKKVDTTASPTANSVTPAPTAVTTPAPSAMGMRPSAVAPGRLTTSRSW